MAIAGRIGAGQHLGAQEWEAFAQRVSAQDLQVEAQMARLPGVVGETVGDLRPVMVADPKVARLQVLDVLAQQIAQPPPDGARAIGQRQLLQGPPLTADIAEVDAAGLLARQPGLQQGDRASTVAQEVGGGGPDDTPADHQHVARGFWRAAQGLSSSMPAGSGLTGACPLCRPTSRTGEPAAWAMISAAAWAQ